VQSSQHEAGAYKQSRPERWAIGADLDEVAECRDLWGIDDYGKLPL
jgi:hypothetical protein